MLSFQEEQEAALKQGLLAVERYDDVLGKSMPNPEHPGRVRGVGGQIPIRKTYEKSSIRRRRAPSRTEAEFEARVDEKVARIEKTLREEMEAKFAMLAQSIGQQVQTYTPTVVQSSCQSVKPVTDLSGFTEVMQIQIHTYLHFNLFSITCLSFIQIILFE
jgi:hypothetical protein